MSHTPGPWVVSQEGPQAIICLPIRSVHGLVGGAFHGAVRTRENAELIALAPKMKEALEKIHDLAGQMGDIHPHVGAIQAWVHEVLPCQAHKGPERFPENPR
jgi:hypothetical protein